MDHTNTAFRETIDEIMVWQLSINQNKMKESTGNERVTYVKTSLDFYPVFFVLFVCSCIILNATVVFAEERNGGDTYSYTNRNNELYSCPNCKDDRSVSANGALLMIKEAILTKLGFDKPPNVTNFIRPNDLPAIDYYINQSQHPHRTRHHDDFMQGDQGFGSGGGDDDVTTPFIWLPASEGTRRSRDQTLTFTLDNKPHLIVKHAKIALYQKNNTNYSQKIKIGVFRVTPGKAHQEMGSFEHVLTEANAVNRWVTFDIDSVAKYFNNRDNPNNITLTIKAVFEDSTKETPPLVTNFTRCGPNKSQNVLPDCNVPYLQLQTEESNRKRNKRSTPNECNSGESVETCCRYPLIVDFEKFEWDFIIAPKNYQAYHCFGKCDFLSNQKYPHGQLVRLSENSTDRKVTTCCGPRSMGSLSMLYFNKQGNIVFGVLPGMIVERCGCQ